MAVLRSSLTSTPLSVARKFRVAAVVIVAAATLAACAPSAGDEPTDSSSSGTSVEESTGDEGTTDAPDGGGLTTDDVGNGTLTVNGVQFPDFVGDCEISRQNGGEDVGDLNEGDIVVSLAIDNVAAHEESSMNYIALNEESFTFRDYLGAAGVGGSGVKGAITLMTELGPRSEDGSRDIVEVRFAGVLDDGTTVDADIVCELQNAFS